MSWLTVSTVRPSALNISCIFMVDFFTKLNVKVVPNNFALIFDMFKLYPI